jgi:23S rRNA pseudouridine955/2504/2580 synthase
MNNIFSKNKVNFYLATDKDEEQRLDNLLIKLLKGVPKSHIYRIIRDGEVRVNKKRADVKYKVQIDDLIRIPPIKIDISKKPEVFIPLAKFPVLFEDEYFLIINKPDGVACHGGSGISFGVIEQLRQNLPDQKFLELAHRLDRDTSGVLILAKKRLALVELQKIMRSGNMKKRYLAMTIGEWKNNQENLKAPLTTFLTKEGERRVKVDPDAGQYSQTNFTIINKYKDFTLVKADLKTGRTHQIRVHTQYLGHPIVGDKKYGDFELNKQLTKCGLKRMFLHAHEVEFIHPMTQEKIKLKSELPTNLMTFVAGLPSK